MTREEAVEVLKERYLTCVGIGLDNHANRVNEAIDMAIETLSAEARPTGEWIPVSERLPENNGCMLVTIDDAIEFGKYEDGEWSIWVCEHWDEWDAKGVIAWMPLPEPWKGGEDE